ncbi:MAG: hypothetical protein Ct9H90mP20_6940 [Candidatus Neomarinimicrobiota bacterium]|nr:MAG: hypothetical protein Ct9H90mP20_6940 [Candidatus Neomarinimicrobiota bacterium]
MFVANYLTKIIFLVAIKLLHESGKNISLKEFSIIVSTAFHVITCLPGSNLGYKVVTLLPRIS